MSRPQVQLSTANDPIAKTIRAAEDNGFLDDKYAHYIPTAYVVDARNNNKDIFSFDPAQVPLYSIPGSTKQLLAITDWGVDDPNLPNVEFVSSVITPMSEKMGFSVIDLMKFMYIFAQPGSNGYISRYYMLNDSTIYIPHYYE